MKKLFLGSLLLMLVAFGSRAQESVRLSANELLDATEGQQEQVIKEHLKQGNAFYRKEIFERAYRHYLRLYELVLSSAALNYRLGVSALLVELLLKQPATSRLHRPPWLVTIIFYWVRRCRRRTTMWRPKKPTRPTTKVLAFWDATVLRKNTAVCWKTAVLAL